MRARVLAVVGSLSVLVAASLWHAPLLRALAPSSMCRTEKATLDSLETTRAQSLAHLRGTGAAPSHAVLGLEIGTTTLALAERPGCAWEVAAALLRCDEPAGSLVARFDRHGLLVGLDRQLDASETAAALQAFELRVREHETRYGVAHTRAGEASLEFLSAPLAQTSARWRFEDLALDVTVTHLGSGAVVREQVRDASAGQTGG